MTTTLQQLERRLDYERLVVGQDDRVIAEALGLDDARLAAWFKAEFALHVGPAEVEASAPAGAWSPSEPGYGIDVVVLPIIAFDDSVVDALALGTGEHKGRVWSSTAGPGVLGVDAIEIAKCDSERPLVLYTSPVAWLKAWRPWLMKEVSAASEAMEIQPTVVRDPWPGEHGFCVPDARRFTGWETLLWGIGEAIVVEGPPAEARALAVLLNKRLPAERRKRRALEPMLPRFVVRAQRAAEVAV